MNPSSTLASTASETCSELSDEDIRSLLEFIGFGKQAGLSGSLAWKKLAISRPRSS